MTDGLFAKERGKGDRTVVFLHGFGATHATWDRIAGQVSETNHVLVYDLPGHGRSLEYDGAGPTKTAAAAVLEDIQDRGCGRAHLVGHSMGGAVAALIALRSPVQVRSLTLLAPGGFGPEINTRLLHRYAAARSESDILACLEVMVGYSNPITRETVADLVAMRDAPGQSEKLVEMAGSLFVDGRQGVIPRERLAELEMPIKVLWGTQDCVLPTRQAHRLPGHIAGHVFEGAGHMLPDEIPGAVIRLLKEAVNTS